MTLSFLKYLRKNGKKTGTRGGSNLESENVRLGDTFRWVRLIRHGRSLEVGWSAWLRTLSSFWKYSRRKEIGFSGRPTHSCTIQSFRTCWMLCLCTYSSHSRKLCSSSRFAAILIMHGAPLYRRYVCVARTMPPPRRENAMILASTLARPRTISFLEGARNR